MSVMELSSAAAIILQEEEEENDYVGFEEGRVWLPTHVLDEVWEFKESLKPRQKHRHDNSNHQQRHQQHQNHTGPKMSSRADTGTFPMYDQFDAHLKPRTSTIFYQRPIIVPGGTRVSPPATTTGMRAVFLDSGEKKCGTGFFLPRRAGQNFQPNKKPACSPVLLPAKVVQALNLNVHELGSQFAPRRDQSSNLPSQGKIANLDSKTNNKNNSINYDVHATRCVAAAKGGHNNSSADIFLPKEWSY
ncbi:hypothetical protein C5167_009946 [Papaver somniferum]|uniref:Uncharacterized protein n=1 Tax=Papaver somniferum TaxID=3469 RepID=A0A4Y7K007_PAPSO|nr:uncharacterized protein LOC113285935 [Papaver somniferum]RZC66267.1 hypothetical protein C5167_009946 [Papaver somniferum]